MSRRAYGFLVAMAIGMGVVAIIVAQATGEELRDPDGFLGPAWIRLPAMVLGAFLIDVLPRALWRSRGQWGRFREHARGIVKEHWTRERIAVVGIGITAFYVVYVSYRNLKNALLIYYEDTQDSMLHQLDRWLFFGNEPAVVMHDVMSFDIFGVEVWTQVLAFTYLIFLPTAPLSIVMWLVWSKNLTHGYWYVTANCLCWTLGTISYYLIPSLGPIFEYPWLYKELDDTGVTQLHEALWNGRYGLAYDRLDYGVQSVAGFASLHCAIVLCIALCAHYTVRAAWVRWTMWVYFVLTVFSTVWFGWHYIADVVAGCLIAVISVYVGGLATGQKFDRHGASSHPTSETSQVPVEESSLTPTA